MRPLFGCEPPPVMVNSRVLVLEPCWRYAAHRKPASKNQTVCREEGTGDPPGTHLRISARSFAFVPGLQQHVPEGLSSARSWQCRHGDTPFTSQRGPSSTYKPGGENRVHTASRHISNVYKLQRSDEAFDKRSLGDVRHLAWSPRG